VNRNDYFGLKNAVGELSRDTRVGPGCIKPKPLSKVGDLKTTIENLRARHEWISDLILLEGSATPALQVLEKTARDSVGTLDEMLATLAKLGGDLEKICQVSLVVPRDPAHELACENERLQNIKDRLDRREVVLAPSEGRPKVARKYSLKSV
jgi:hypothetical protein